MKRSAMALAALLWMVGASVCFSDPRGYPPPPCQLNLSAFGWRGRLSDTIFTRACPDEIRVTGEDPVRYSNYFSYSGHEPREEAWFGDVPVPPQRSYYYRVQVTWLAFYWRKKYDPDHDGDDEDDSSRFAEHEFPTHYEIHLSSLDSGHTLSWQFYLHSWDIPKYY